MNQQIIMSENDTPQEGMNPELEVEVEETTIEESIETPDLEDVEALKVRIAELEEAKRQLTARAKKAEGVKTPQQPQKITNSLSAEEVEIKILKAAGRSDDEIRYLKKLGAVNDMSLIDAQKDELFVSYQKKNEDDEKAQKAKLGASKGSGSVRKEKEISSPGISDADHKELWKAQQGR